MPADNPHAEVERVIAEALAEAVYFDLEKPRVRRQFARRVLAAIRDDALRDGRLTPEQVGKAVGLRADFNTSSVEKYGARLAVAPEEKTDA